MFKMILFTQWKAVRLPLAVATVVAFTLPVLSVGTGGSPPNVGFAASHVLVQMTEWAFWYPLLAGGIGLLLAITAWSPDVQQNHVYARTLPIARWRYVLLRLSAAGTLLTAPAAMLLIGGVVATAIVSLPAGLSAYPVALAIRFALAGGVALTMFFAIAAGSARTAGLILASLAVLIVAQGLTALAGGVAIIDPIFSRLLEWPSPMMIFGGRWMLIDV